MATRSFSPSCSTSRCRPHCTSGSLFGSSIEPETSTRNTRLLGGRRDWSIGLAAMPMRASRCSAFHGQPAISTCTANGCSLDSAGGASSYAK